MMHMPLKRCGTAGTTSMICHVSVARGSLRLSSLSSDRAPRDHLYGSVAALTPIDCDPHEPHTRWHPDTPLYLQLAYTSASARLPVAYLVGRVSNSVGQAARSTALAAAQLDTAFHLSALPEARGGDSASCDGGSALVPAAAQLYIHTQESATGACQLPALHASAAVRPAQGNHMAINASFLLAADGEPAAPCRLEGMSARQLLQTARTDPPLAQAQHQMLYSTEWQSSSPWQPASWSAPSGSGVKKGAKFRLAACQTPRQCAAAIVLMQHAGNGSGSGSEPLAVSIVSSGGMCDTPAASPQRTSSDSTAAMESLFKSTALELGSANAGRSSRQDGNHPGALTASFLHVSSIAPAALNPESMEPGQMRFAGVALSARLVPCPVVSGTNAFSSDGDGAVPAIRGGSFLITGGLGSLGAVAARWLLSCGAARLQLTGRSAHSVSPGLVLCSQSAALVTITQSDISTAADCDLLLGDSRSWLTGALCANHSLNSGFLLLNYYDYI